jgi:hypothetical protein
MDILLKRSSFEDSGIYGAFTSEDGSWSCVTLEHAFPTNITGAFVPKIPLGTYQCIRRLSPHFGFDVFCLVGVPDHAFLEIHVGNYNTDSDGCILLGATRQGNMITSSRDTFDSFMKFQAGVGSFNLVVS